MGIGGLIRRADEAVQETASTVSLIAVLAGVALAVATVALVIAARRQS